MFRPQWAIIRYFYYNCFIVCRVRVRINQILSCISDCIYIVCEVYVNETECLNIISHNGSEPITYESFKENTRKMLYLTE
jgi:hypothetical protein